ncbi:hypothetical protein C8A05DRAFT_12486 [Staphylotrichum tortipilum]|uniref:Uncharacterized protein n=1 Tax=Staphylotrichum tortipilum TaxID=2831512 RepID=A0AAN6MSB9_9PEZI|nr:hypothetical protein C8A05DRAFT_12486 [Staphylotrichum longicolle]
MASNNTSSPPAPKICDKSSSPLLSSLPIPQNINVVSTPGNDTSWPGMVVCCTPNPVQIVNGCYLWCEVPARYFNGTSSRDAESDVMSCVMRNANDEDGGRILGVAFNAAPRVGAVKWMGVWGLVVSGVVFAM